MKHSHRRAELRVIKAARSLARVFRGLTFPSKRGRLYRLVKAVEVLDRRKK